MINATLLRRALAEAVGAFGLVFAGTGAIMIDAESGGMIGHLGIGLTFGLIIMVMIYATGHISGAHFNPAVTIAFAAARHFPLSNVPVYILAQLAGAVAASALLRAMFGGIADLGATFPAGSDSQSFILETVLTFFLMFVIIAVATDVRAVGQAAAIAIGGTVGLEAIFAGPISGASMNPARSLAPALLSGTWESQWLYIAAPVLGALAGAFVYVVIRAVPQEETA
ncbi:MAG: aquaporin [Thermomicrobiales bacterium]